MYIEWLGQSDCHLCSRTGGKAAQLSRLVADYSIPPGYCVTAAAFELWNGSALKTNGLPPELRAPIMAAYAELGALRDLSEMPVAVRSSSLIEDGSKFSFAGQFETVLNVVGDEKIMEAVIGCYASAQSENVQAYGAYNNLSTSAAMAVLIQELVIGDVAAVAFCMNPITGDTGEVVINANWGLGASIVNGTVDPDYYLVGKSNFEIVKKTVAEKQLMTVPIDGGGIDEVQVPKSLRSSSTLRDNQIIEVAELAVDLENFIGKPIEIEVCYRGEKLNLLQCRPITTIGRIARVVGQ